MVSYFLKTSEILLTMKVKYIWVLGFTKITSIIFLTLIYFNNSETRVFAKLVFQNSELFGIMYIK